MGSVASGKFWRGKISTTEHAEKIIAGVGWGFVIIFCSFVLFPMIFGLFRDGIEIFNLRSVALPLVLVVALVFLLSSGSVIAAWVLFCFSVYHFIVASLALVMVLTGLKTGLNIVALLFFPPFWLFVSIAAWRARRAAKFLSENPESIAKHFE